MKLKETLELFKNSYDRLQNVVDLFEFCGMESIKFNLLRGRNSIEFLDRENETVATFDSNNLVASVLEFYTKNKLIYLFDAYIKDINCVDDLDLRTLKEMNTIINDLIDNSPPTEQE